MGVLSGELGVVFGAKHVLEGTREAGQRTERWTAVWTGSSAYCWRFRYLILIVLYSSFDHPFISFSISIQVGLMYFGSYLSITLHLITQWSIC